MIFEKLNPINSILKKIIIKFKEDETESIDIEEDKIKEIAKEMAELKKLLEV